MRIPAMLLCAAYLIGQSHAQTLSDGDREALLDNLEKLREAATSHVDGKYRVALAAFRNAMSSDDQAIELYLNCYEKVNYDEQQKKTQEFREWRRKEADKLADTSFRKALRIQLSWLILTLQASAEKPDIAKITHDAGEIVDSIFREAEKLAPQEKLLSEGVIGTVFARAYEINHIKADNWPASPTLLDQFYGQLVLPPLRTPGHLPALRAEWIKRIQQEGEKRKYWGRPDGRRPGGAAPSTADFERFLSDDLPKLQWEMEVDLFNSGDENGAAVRMLAHIEKYIAHPSAREWSEQFKALLKPAAPAAPAAPTAAAP
jgi:hypothetical protein